MFAQIETRKLSTFSKYRGKKITTANRLLKNPARRIFTGILKKHREQEEICLLLEVSYVQESCSSQHRGGCEEEPLSSEVTTLAPVTSFQHRHAPWTNRTITQRCKKETQVQGWTPHIFSKNKWTQKYNVPVKKKIGISVRLFFFLFVNTRYAELSSQAFFTSGFAGTLAIQPWFTTGCSDQQMRRWKDGSNPGPHDPHVC